MPLSTTVLPEKEFGDTTEELGALSKDGTDLLTFTEDSSDIFYKQQEQPCTRNLQESTKAFHDKIDRNHLEDDKDDNRSFNDDLNIKNDIDNCFDHNSFDCHNSKDVNLDHDKCLIFDLGVQSIDSHVSSTVSY